MTETEIIKLINDVADGRKPNGDNLPRDLKDAIYRLYDKGWGDGYKAERNFFSSDTDAVQSLVDKAVKSATRKLDKAWEERFDIERGQITDHLEFLDRKKTRLIESIVTLLDEFKGINFTDYGLPF